MMHVLEQVSTVFAREHHVTCLVPVHLTPAVPCLTELHRACRVQTLNPVWNQEFVFRVKPAEHRLVLEVYDENRLTRDDFLGRIELPLSTLPSQREGRIIAEKNYVLRPRRYVRLLPSAALSRG